MICDDPSTIKSSSQGQVTKRNLQEKALCQKCTCQGMRNEGFFYHEEHYIGIATILHEAKHESALKILTSKAYTPIQN